MNGDNELSRDYHRQAKPMPPRTLDRQVLRLARQAHGKSPCLAPLALAATVLLSIGLVLAIILSPPAARHIEEAPRLLRTALRADMPARAPIGRALQLYSSDPPTLREPGAWRAEIAALRRAGRNSEADAEYRRFRKVYPQYAADDAE